MLAGCRSQSQVTTTDAVNVRSLLESLSLDLVYHDTLTFNLDTALRGVPPCDPAAPTPWPRTGVLTRSAHTVIGATAQVHDSTATQGRTEVTQVKADSGPRWRFTRWALVGALALTLLNLALTGCLVRWMMQPRS